MMKIKGLLLEFNLRVDRIKQHQTKIEEEIYELHKEV